MAEQFEEGQQARALFVGKIKSVRLTQHLLRRARRAREAPLREARVTEFAEKMAQLAQEAEQAEEARRPGWEHVSHRLRREVTWFGQQLERLAAAARASDVGARDHRELLEVLHHRETPLIGGGEKTLDPPGAFFRDMDRILLGPERETRKHPH
jgi:hypothetical protein